MSPVLIVLSVFTISLALGAYVRRSMILEGDRFVVAFKRRGFIIGDYKIIEEEKMNAIKYIA